MNGVNRMKEEIFFLLLFNMGTAYSTILLLYYVGYDVVVSCGTSLQMILIDFNSISMILIIIFMELSFSAPPRVG